MYKNITEYFISLITIDSESKNEKQMAERVANDLKEMGATIYFDNANDKTGGNIGNLYGYFEGNPEIEPILFCAHLDTVVPGNGIKPQIKDGVIVSDGTTILGSDDKSGIAQIIWAIKELQEEKFNHAPIEILFTISEEIGLLGAKYCDPSKLKSKIGYALDAHTVGSLMSGAPSQSDITLTITGKASHAGAAPELGVNAIKIAAEAITQMPSGRIDFETTCNVGIIKGGKATNIVPDNVEIECEVRSHDPNKLKHLTQQIIDAAETVVKSKQEAGIETDINYVVHDAYKAFRIDDSHQVIKIAEKATNKINLPFSAAVGGGGSDANMLNLGDMTIAVAGTGMDKVHTVHECIKVIDLENGANWVKEVIKIHSS